MDLKYSDFGGLNGKKTGLASKTVFLKEFSESPMKLFQQEVFHIYVYQKETTCASVSCGQWIDSYLMLKYFCQRLLYEKVYQFNKRLTLFCLRTLS